MPTPGSDHLPYAQISWEAGPSAIEYIPEANIDPQTQAYINQGHAFEWAPGHPAIALVSDGFTRCAAVIIRNSETDSLTLAHAQPFDDELYRKMADSELGPGDAVIVSGTLSVPQSRFESVLRDSGITISQIRVESGTGQRFGVALDVRTKELVVARTVPDRSIFKYRPFA